MNFQHIIENGRLVQLAAPATDAAGRTSAYVSLKGYKKAFLIFTCTQGNAAPIQLDPKQASAVAGTGAKALTQNCRIWTNLDAATNDTFTRQTAAKTYTTDAAVKNKTVVFEIDAAELDLANGFTCLALTTGASNVANITAIMAVLVEPRYPQAATQSAVVD